MTTDFDAIVVGARCAGAPTAMLLAGAGHRVLLVDRATRRVRVAAGLRTTGYGWATPCW